MRGFSRGMYSNWLWHRPLQLLVDAGEGLQIALGANVFGGKPWGPFGQLAQDDNIYFQVRYEF